MRVIVDAMRVYINSCFPNLEGLIIVLFNIYKYMCQNSLLSFHLNNLEGNSFIDKAYPNRSFRVRVDPDFIDNFDAVGSSHVYLEFSVHIVSNVELHETFLWRFRKHQVVGHFIVASILCKLLLCFFFHFTQIGSGFSRIYLLAQKYKRLNDLFHLIVWLSDRIVPVGEDIYQRN